MAKFKALRTGETNINSTDIWRFCIHSDYPTQKIYSAGQTTLTIPNGLDYGTVSVNHSLGYRPSVSAVFQVYGNRYVRVIGKKRVKRPDNQDSTYMTTVGTSSITFDSFPPFGGSPAVGDVTITIYYIIFYEDI